MSVLFHPLRVRAIEPDTEEAVIVSFDVPPELREVFGFTQGQYLTLRTHIEGQDLRRSYSICAGVDDGELRVGVRKAPPPVACPRCGSVDTERLSAFGSTACKSMYRCLACREPFEHFKAI